MKGETALDYVINWGWLIIIIIIVSATLFVLLKPQIDYFFEVDELKLPNEYQSCLRLAQNQGDSTPDFRAMLTDVRCSFMVIKCKTYNGTEWCNEEKEYWTAPLPT